MVNFKKSRINFIFITTAKIINKKKQTLKMQERRGDIGMEILNGDVVLERKRRVAERLLKRKCGEWKRAEVSREREEILS